MKIKTITCHDVYNAGASLQAYALAKYLKNIGHDVEIIDYKPEYLRHYRLWGVVNPVYNRPVLREVYCLAKLPSRLKSRVGRRKREFDNFKKKYLPITAYTYHSNEDLKAASLVADVIFAGSDQIWNIFFRNGKDPAFYLDFAPENCIKASYAASFATETVPLEWKQQLKEWISGLDYISVRESSGVHILYELGILKGQQVLDPVFLLLPEEWKSLADKWDNPEKKPYLLIYDFDNNPELISFAKKIASDKDLKIISVLKNKFIKQDYSSEGPIAFLSLIAHAEVVVSNSFHATAFSLIFQKQFWIFNRNEKINTRMRDLTQTIGIRNHLIDSSIPEDTGKLIDYDNVNSILKSEIRKSQDYISAVLSGVDND